MPRPRMRTSKAAKGPFAASLLNNRLYRRIKEIVKGQNQNMIKGRSSIIFRRNQLAIVLIFLVTFALICCSPKKKKAEVSLGSSYEDLVSLFKEWREFQKSTKVDSMSDYILENHSSAPRQDLNSPATYPLEATGE